MALVVVNDRLLTFAATSRSDWLPLSSAMWFAVAQESGRLECQLPRMATMQIER